MPRLMDEAISCPANMEVEPTDRKPVTDEMTMTGISMKVLRYEYKASACL